LGTLGYVWIEEVPVADALYMTVITLTAVGYEEVFELSPWGRTFTIFVLLSGISWLGLWFANITAFIVELDLKHAIEKRPSTSFTERGRIRWSVPTSAARSAWRRCYSGRLWSPSWISPRARRICRCGSNRRPWPASSPLVGKTLAEAKIPEETGLIVINAVRKEQQSGGPFVFNPTASTTIDAGDDVIVLGAEEQIKSLRAYLA
jgi:hypothetical protein